MKEETMLNTNFTGAFFVPGSTDTRIEQDHVERYKFAKDYVDSAIVLDIACGIGYGTEILASGVNGDRKVFGVDIQNDNVEAAKKAYGSDRIVFHRGDILTYETDTLFDVIVCFETIEHVDAYKDALSNLFRLLKKGGTLLISSPNRVVTSPQAVSLRDKPSNPYHTQEFTIKELRKELIDVGFIIGKQDIYGQRQSIPTFKSGRLRRVVRLFWKHETMSSPKVTPVTWLTPRYFLIIATK